MTQNMHGNSLSAWDEEEAKLTKRATEILVFMRSLEHPATDREIQAMMGFAERGMVQPRISDLVRLGFAEEVDSAICEITGKRVRLVKAVARKIQMSLF